MAFSSLAGYNMHIMNKKALFGSVLLFTAALVWGLAFVFQSQGMDNLPPFTFTAIRVGLAAAVVFLTQLILEGKKGLKYDKKTVKAGVVCGLITFVVMAFQQVGLVKTDPGKAGFITSLYIIIVPIFSRIILKKKESLRTWCGVAIGLVGLYLLCVQGNFSIVASDLAIMLCAVFFALYVLYISEYCQEIDSLSLNFIQLAITSILSLVVALIFEEPTLDGVVAAKIPILYCGIVSAGLGFTLQLVGQKSVNPTIAAVIMSFESVFSVLAGWLIMNSTLSTRELLGCGIMFVANIIIQFPDKISYSDDLLRKQKDHPNV